MLVGTVGPFVARSVVDAALAAGADRRQFAAIPAAEWLGDDRVRIPTAQLLRLWEAAKPALVEAGGAARVAEAAGRGGLHLFSYLLGTAGALAEGLRTVARHVHLVADGAEQLTVVRDDAGLTGCYVWARNTPSADLIDEYVVTQLLRLARLATGSHLIPVSIRLTGPAPSRHGHLVEEFGTRRIEFDAPHLSITFANADAERPMPRADPALSAILNDYAEQFLAGVRPVQRPPDSFQAAFDACCAEGEPDLARVARRLAMSPRTLQRRLQQEGTTWRQELERMRQMQADMLLRTTPLSVESIAARVGYSDVRALRRAVRRWYGKSPNELRVQAGMSDPTS